MPPLPPSAARGPAQGAPTAYPTPDSVCIPPPGPPSSTRPPNLLALFHGTGDSPAPYATLARSLALPATACVALASRHPLAGGRAWFYSHDEGTRDPLPLSDARLAASAAETAASTAATLDASGWPRGRIHLFGCGGGAVGALTCVAAAARAGGDAYGSCVAIGGALPHAVRARLEAETARSSGGTPTLITRGERDADLAPADVDASAAALRRAGCDVVAYTVPGKSGALLTGAHEDEVRQCMLVWAKTLKRAPPPGTVEVGR